SFVKDAQPNRTYEIDEARAVNSHSSVVSGQSQGTTTRGPQVTAPGPVTTPLFEDLSSRLNHQHADQPYDDFARQPLLARRLSTLGPGLSWGDVDRTGRGRFLIAGRKVWR